MNVKILGHEPAAWLGVIEAFLALILALNLFGLSAEQVGVIMAFVTAGFGLLTAWVTRDTLLSAIVGFAKSALVLGIAFGLQLNDTQTAMMIGFVTAIAGFFLRTQTASVVTPLTSASRGAYVGEHRKEAA